MSSYQISQADIEFARDGREYLQADLHRPGYNFVCLKDGPPLRTERCHFLAGKRPSGLHLPASWQAFLGSCILP